MRQLVARIIALAGTGLALWGCTEIMMHPARCEAGSWCVFLGLLVVLVAACWDYRLREERSG